MEPGTLKTLSLFLEAVAGDGIVVPPSRAKPFAFLNAHPLPGGAPFPAEAVTCEQGLRPVFLDLQAAGYRAAPRLEEPASALAGALVLAGRNRRANEAMIARANDLTATGGAIIVCGANDDGIRSLRKWVSGVTPVETSIAKHHAVAFLVRSREAVAFGEHQEAIAISPGMFSPGKTDKGSLMLARHFDARIKGVVADFGAGQGYLAGQILEKCPGIGRLDLIEADHASLERARIALSAIAHPAKRSFKWLDLAREKPCPAGSLDWIVMNPPFHAGRAAQPRLGQQFIEAAGEALRTGGRLLMVANRNLPYEKTLASKFRRMLVLEEGGGYKVIEAVK